MVAVTQDSNPANPGGTSGLVNTKHARFRRVRDAVASRHTVADYFYLALRLSGWINNVQRTCLRGGVPAPIRCLYCPRNHVRHATGINDGDLVTGK